MPVSAPVPPRFIALVGPTASGKTELSLVLALALDGEIVSMDSRQVYRGMDVGTDKVVPEERARVPHHGLDLVEPDERYSAGRFARDARRWIEEIEGRGRTPILAGGTGFFLKALIEPIFREPPMDRGRLRGLRRYLRSLSGERMEEWARHLDPARAPIASAGGTQRLGRTLEIALLTGRPLSWWHRHAPPDAPPVPGLVVLLHIARDELDRRIDHRVGRMMDRGLAKEVRMLLAAGYRAGDPGMSGTGYREVAAWLRGEITREEAVERTKKATRAYARRQLTWFRNQLPDDVVRVDALQPVEETVERIRKEWERRRSRPGLRGRGDRDPRPGPGAGDRREGRKGEA